PSQKRAPVAGSNRPRSPVRYARRPSVWIKNGSTNLPPGPAGPNKYPRATCEPAITISPDSPGGRGSAGSASSPTHTSTPGNGQPTGRGESRAASAGSIGIPVTATVVSVGP